MIPARCWWPLLDLDVEHERAVQLAVRQLPAIAAEAGWLDWLGPTRWRYAECLRDGEPTLFLICDLLVFATPADYLPAPEVLAAETAPADAAALWQSRRGAAQLAGRSR